MDVIYKLMCKRLGGRGVGMYGGSEGGPVLCLTIGTHKAEKQFRTLISLQVFFSPLAQL